MKYQDICGVLENIDICGWLSATELVSKIRGSIESNEVWIENPFYWFSTKEHFWQENQMETEQRTLINVNNYLNTNIYSYLETSGGQSSNLYLKVVHFFNTSVK